MAFNNKTKPAPRADVTMSQTQSPPAPDQMDAETLAILRQEAGAGFENADVNDIGIPFLNIIQGLSPELQRSSAKFIQSAEMGMAFNTMNRELYECRVGSPGSEPIVVIPCSYRKAYPEWKPRDGGSGGGFVRNHESSDILRSTNKNAKNEDELPNKNVIVTTAYFAVLVKNQDGSFTPAIIPMKGTQLKKARGWLSVSIQRAVDPKTGESFQLPMYSHEYNLTTVEEKNEKGTFWGWRIEKASPIKKANIDAAKNLLTQSQSFAALPAPTETVEENPEDVLGLEDAPKKKHY